MEKSPSKLKRKYAAIQYSTFVGEFLSIAAPFITIGIINYDKYFVQFDGVRMSIAFIMAMALMGFAIIAIAKQKLENTFIIFIMRWAVMAFIFTMIGEMIMDLATIMWFGLIGLGGSFGLDLVSKKYKKKKLGIIEAKAQADKEEMVEAVKEEKKVKVKVIKK